ncbi:GIY-YIG nuclease family protein [Microbacterium sp. ASV49]|uniref:GIY-YIG nuclease family protein n=1 Tax=Microbacterium candidum TaxID=3041922 RepID=A0ABT7N1M2_9MICO|nr:GIY-YIG nuclease family protein [Microbacterium sp. ASV49]MDL9980561.1 GIY-YIG nuclease family protein [Microbacterium sp. ASV49]
MPHVYILRCRDGSYYTGSTDKDPEIRVWEHNNDEHLAARYTIKRRPVVLVYLEEFEQISAAFAREKQVQNWSRAKKEALIEERGHDLPRLARSGPAASAKLADDAESGHSDR